MVVKVINKGVLNVTLTICIIGILLATTLVPVVDTHNINTDSMSKISNTTPISSNGNTLYVGGNGPDNYTRIQDAIDNASDGDTVYVYDGIYFGNIVINVSIELIGENKNTTIIDENTDIEDPQLVEANIYIFADSVNISGFTIQNCYGCGIFLASSHVTITNNIFLNNTHGIHFYIPNLHVTITNNSIANNMNGIYCVSCTNNTISRNIIKNNSWGIRITQESNNNGIFHNTIISNSEYGIMIGWKSMDNTIRQNNLLNNGKQAYFRLLSYHNTWEKNYWDKPRMLPYPIIGSLGLSIPNWVNFDWHPAIEPFEW